MLRNIDPILTPELLHILCAMGHGDEIVIVDANFPGQACTENLIRLAGLEAPRVLRAILSLMPLDNFVDDPAIAMQVVDAPDTIPPVVAAFQNVINTIANNPAKIIAVERFSFYERAQNAFAIVQTGEWQLYGNLILKKGIVSLEKK